MCEPIQIPADGPKILFTSPWGPYAKRAVEDDPVDYFYYRNTLKQGPCPAAHLPELALPALHGAESPGGINSARKSEP